MLGSEHSDNTRLIFALIRQIYLSAYPLAFIKVNKFGYVFSKFSMFIICCNWLDTANIYNNRNGEKLSEHILSITLKISLEQFNSDNFLVRIIQVNGYILTILSWSLFHVHLAICVQRYGKKSKKSIISPPCLNDVNDDVYQIST